MARSTTRSDRARRGAAGEALAAFYLETQGLTVVARNLRCKMGELDVVCRDGEVLVIVEVRSRGREDFGGALASITWHKQRKLVRATQYFCQQRRDWRGLTLRFDVFAIQGRADGSQRTQWIQNAF